MNNNLAFAMAAAGLMSFSAVNAAPIYLDIGVDYDTNATRSLTQVTSTSTSIKNEILYLYDSSTTITDLDGSGTISIGDSVLTNAGIIVSGFNSVGLQSNQITGFNPNQSGLTASNNGYGNDWWVTFSIESLIGTVVGVQNNVPLFQYGPGLLEMYITTDATNFYNFMDINIDGGGATGVSTVLSGDVDFTNVSNLPDYRNLFNFGNNSCSGSNGFYDIWQNCGDGAGGPMTIYFETSMDTNVLLSQFAYNPVLQQFTVTTNHDGSAVFYVPEPASLALIGLGLLGFAGVARRSQAA